jgi:hypothetical protein
MKIKIFGILRDVTPIKVILKEESTRRGEKYYSFCAKLGRGKKFEPITGYEQHEDGKWLVFNRLRTDLNQDGFIGEYKSKEKAIMVAKARLFAEVGYLARISRNNIVLSIGKELLTDTRYLDILVDLGERGCEKYNEDPRDISNALELE